MADVHRSRRMRVYVFAFDIALAVVAVVFVVLAAAGSDEERGGYIGMAAIWDAIAFGAVAVTVAVERKGPAYRRSAF